MSATNTSNYSPLLSILQKSYDLLILRVTPPEAGSPL